MLRLRYISGWLAGGAAVAFCLVMPSLRAAGPATAPIASAESIGPTEPAKLKFFEEKVRPILAANCFKCHGGGETLKGELYLTSRTGILSGGENGPVVNLENPRASRLIKAINWATDDLQMPQKNKLSADKIDTLTKWVEMGLPYTPSTGPDPVVVHTPKRVAPQVNAETMKFWSYQPATRPAVPPVKLAGWGHGPIDNFILARLEAKNIRPAAPADKVALLRRAYYDLTGLPPSPAEVDAFLADNSVDAYERVIDRLLASPRYGEKWGRFWLDLVRFAETNSFERDGVKPNAWRYRDYVIDSFNADKPYNQFIREQIAGDELDKVTAQSIIATGYYRLGLWDDEPSDRARARFDELDDIVATTGQVFLGMTINCARCHDHKLDPIPQRDYYRMLAFFQGIKPYTTDGPNILTDISAENAKAAKDEQLALERRRTEVQRQIADIEKAVVDSFGDADRLAIKKAPDRAAFIAAKVLEVLGPQEKDRFDALHRELPRLERQQVNSEMMALSAKENGPNPGETFVLGRGNPTSPGETVEPGFPSVLNPPTPVIPKPVAGAKSSGRRRVLADWLAGDKNTITARVMINRIWQGHFGRGIVRSASDFGSVGDRPTHPELLDWLTTEFIARGWQLKSMHKLIMMSAAYQMSSEGNAAALAVDPQNDLFWRFDMRRLQAEEVRDSILAVNGKLNLKMYGPGIYPTIPAGILAGQSVPGAGWGKSSPEEQARRSIYVHVKRSLMVPVLASLDSPDPDASCAVRFQTTQSTQALAMINGEFVNEEAKALAARLRKEAGNDVAAEVKLGLRLALSREPALDEIDRGVRFIQRLQKDHKASADLALNQFCLIVLNLNEFVYLD